MFTFNAVFVHKFEATSAREKARANANHAVVAPGNMNAAVSSRAITQRDAITNSDIRPRGHHGLGDESPNGYVYFF